MKEVKVFHFVPASNPAFLEKATKLKNCSIILDLEDGINSSELNVAIENINLWFEHPHSNIYWVRIDNVSTISHLSGAARRNIILPKVENVSDVENLLSHQGVLNVLPLIESLPALKQVSDVTGINAVSHIGIGFEDLHSKFIESPNDQLLFWNNILSQFCRDVRINNKIPVASVFTKINDGDELYNNCKWKKSCGFQSMFSIHPSQIDTISRIFSPSDKDIDWAKKVISSWESFQGDGYSKINGDILSKPLAKKAYAIISAMESNK